MIKTCSTVHVDWTCHYKTLIRLKERYDLALELVSSLSSTPPSFIVFHSSFPLFILSRRPDGMLSWQLLVRHYISDNWITIYFRKRSGKELEEAPRIFIHSRCRVFPRDEDEAKDAAGRLRCSTRLSVSLWFISGLAFAELFNWNADSFFRSENAFRAFMLVFFFCAGFSAFYIYLTSSAAHSFSSLCAEFATRIKNVLV